MALDLDALVASLPVKQEQKRLQELDKRRQQILEKFENDSLLSNTKDPRKLNSAEQCIYIIRCLEHGLGKSQIVDLFVGDEFVVDTMINVIGANNLTAEKNKK